MKNRTMKRHIMMWMALVVASASGVRADESGAGGTPPSPAAVPPGSGATEAGVALGDLEKTSPPSARRLSPFADEVLPAHYEVMGIVTDPEVTTPMAIIDYRGESYVVTNGTAVPNSDDPAFIVRSVRHDGVNAFDPRSQRMVRRTLRSP